MRAEKPRTITRQQAGRFLLAHQGLRPPYGLEGKAGILDFVRRVGAGYRFSGGGLFEKGRPEWQRR